MPPGLERSANTVKPAPRYLHIGGNAPGPSFQGQTPANPSMRAMTHSNSSWRIRAGTVVSLPRSAIVRNAPSPIRSMAAASAIAHATSAPRRDVGAPGRSSGPVGSASDARSRAVGGKVRKPGNFVGSGDQGLPSRACRHIHRPDRGANRNAIRRMMRARPIRIRAGRGVFRFGSRCGHDCAKLVRSDCRLVKCPPRNRAQAANGERLGLPSP